MPHVQQQERRRRYHPVVSLACCVVCMFVWLEGDRHNACRTKYSGTEPSCGSRSRAVCNAFIVKRIHPGYNTLPPRLSSSRHFQRVTTTHTPFTIQPPSLTLRMSSNEPPTPYEQAVSQFSSMTVAQLKQQLRLRTLKVSGNKAVLVKRLVDDIRSEEGLLAERDVQTLELEEMDDQQDFEAEKVLNEMTEGELMAEGADSDGVVDVSNYIDAETVPDFVEYNYTDTPSPSSSSTSTPEPPPNTEDWGSAARILQTLENPRIIDNLSRQIIEFNGSNNQKVRAYVVATQQALSKYLSGGRANPYSRISPAKRVGEIQRRREAKDRKSYNDEPPEGEEDDVEDEEVLRRMYWEDAGDVGMVSTTGARLSAQEVEGVVLLSDVLGPFDGNARELADKIAFECQPCVVLAPDVFRGSPWVEPVGMDPIQRGIRYEAWREVHAPIARVHADIRGAAATLRYRYAVSSIAVFGTCYGGGRALECAAGFSVEGESGVSIGRIEGAKGLPPPVKPRACIAWYPTRYNATALFGLDYDPALCCDRPNSMKHNITDADRVAVCALFAGEDTLPGATPADAALLKSVMDQDPHVMDTMVKVFEDQEHGFAHKHLLDGFQFGAELDQGQPGNQFESPNHPPTDSDEPSGDYGDAYGTSSGQHPSHEDAEIARLLSTSWMETYTRMFLPTLGDPVNSPSGSSSEWKTLSMRDVKKNSRHLEYDEFESAYQVREDDEFLRGVEEDELERNKEWDDEYLDDNEDLGYEFELDQLEDDE